MRSSLVSLDDRDNLNLVHRAGRRRSPYYEVRGDCQD